MQRRRTILATVGSVLTLGVGPTAVARRESSEPSTETVNRAFHEAMMEGRAAEARRILETLGLDPIVDVVRDSPMEGSGNGESVLQGVRYGDPRRAESELVVGTCNAPSLNTVYVTVAMFLDAPTIGWHHAAYCPDVIGIGYDPDDWAGVGVPSLKTTGRHGARFRPDTVGVGVGVLAGAVTLRNHVDRRKPGTVAMERLPPAGVTLTGEFTLLDDGEPSRFWGSYAHTCSLTPVSGIKRISSESAGLSVEVGGFGSTCWSASKTADPREHLSARPDGVRSE